MSVVKSHSETTSSSHHQNHSNGIQSFSHSIIIIIITPIPIILFLLILNISHSLFNVEVMTGTEVTRVNASERELTLRDVASGTASVLHYDKLVLSPGSKPFVPPTPGANHPRISTLTTIPAMDTIKKYVDEELTKKPSQRRPLLVIGGGFIGVELAESVAHGKKLPCTIIELGDQIMVLFPLPPSLQSPLQSLSPISFFFLNILTFKF